MQLERMVLDICTKKCKRSTMGRRARTGWEKLKGQIG